MIKITTHTIVRNEENWVWYALMAFKDYASEMLVVDDDSTDNTVNIIKSIQDSKIKLLSRKLATPADLTKMRNETIAKTKTDWFLILDGDEVWNKDMAKKFFNFLEQQDKNIYAVVMRTRNCVGDVRHYQPEDAGKYHLLGKTGHLNIRAYRKLPGFSWRGDYPLEAYTDKNGQPINGQNDHLVFFDGYYWHMTHLPRSSIRSVRKHDQLTKLEMGIPVSDKTQLPEVFFLPRPDFVPSPWVSPTRPQRLLSAILTQTRIIKRKFLK